MLVLKKVEEYTAQKPLFLALGNFDGVHAGHQQILKRAVEDARKTGGLSAAMTFAVHPQAVLHEARLPRLLYSSSQKQACLEKTGLDLCFLLSFTQEFSKMEAEDFVAEILVSRLKVRKVYLGDNARFGHGRKGDAALMRRLAAQHGFEFEAVPPVTVDGQPVSSSRIRSFVEAGEFKSASALLGRPFSMFLKVVHGDGRGAGLGFPTANFDTQGRVLPTIGVYPAALRPAGGGSWHQAVANCGRRPTFHTEDSPVVLEAFLLDYSGGELYGREFEVLFYPRIRPEQTFPGVEALKAQILKDIEAAREQFRRNPPSSS